MGQKSFSDFSAPFFVFYCNFTKYLAKLLRLNKKKKLVSLFCVRLFVTLSPKIDYIVCNNEEMDHRRL